MATWATRDRAEAAEARVRELEAETADLRKAAAETVKVLDIMLERQTLTGAATARDWLRAALSGSLRSPR